MAAATKPLSPRKNPGRWLCAPIGLALAFLACGDGDQPPRFLYRESFEEVCADGLPCGWVQIGGAAGQVTYGELLHPGERGLTLTGPDVVLLGPSAPPESVVLLGGMLDLRLAGRCEGGSSLVVEATIVVPPPGDASPVQSDTARGRATGDWDEGVFTLVLQSASDPSSPFSGSSVPSPFQITSVTIQKTGVGTCYIGELVIDDVNAAVSGPDNAC